MSEGKMEDERRKDEGWTKERRRMSEGKMKDGRRKDDRYWMCEYLDL